MHADCYLAQHWKTLVRHELTDNNKYKQSLLVLSYGKTNAVDFLSKKGYGNVAHIDFKNPQDDKRMHHNEPTFCHPASLDGIYVEKIFSIFENEEKEYLVKEIRRIARPSCLLMIDLYTSAPKYKDVLELQSWLIGEFDWTVQHNDRGQCILQK